MLLLLPAVAIRLWQIQVRGVTRLDTEVTDEELAANHIVLVGGPKLNSVSRRLMEAQPNWPLPRKERAFLLYDRQKKVDKELGFDEFLIGAVTFNPLNPKLRVWAIICDSPDAFSEPDQSAKAVAGRRHRYDSQSPFSPEPGTGNRRE